VLVMLLHPDGSRQPLAIGLPGDRDVDAKRLATQVAPAEVEAFGDNEFAARPGLVKGYIGPSVLGARNATGIRYLLDPSVAVGSSWVTGADVPGQHVLHLVYGRDFSADGTIQAAEIRQGDPSPDGHGVLTLARGIEMGHIFQLGTKYAEVLGLKVLDSTGKLVTVTMGSYGVGVSRAVAAVAEDNHDDRGLIWTRELAPADVHLVAMAKTAVDEVFVKAAEIAENCAAQGLSVLYDDRPKVSPGVKFKDAELIGVPTILVIGKSLADGQVEIRDRRSGRSRAVPVDGAVDELLAEVRG